MTKNLIAVSTIGNLLLIKTEALSKIRGSNFIKIFVIEAGNSTKKIKEQFLGLINKK